MKYVFRIEDKIKPYVRMTQRSKGLDAQAIEYLANKQAMQFQFKGQMMENNWDMLPLKTPLYMKLDYTVGQRLHGFDLDNVVKAVADALQEIVIGNDLWIDQIEAKRQLGDSYVGVIEIGVLR